MREALEDWPDAQRRAESLPPSRLLYDARMGTSGLPSVPGTLAVTYDGERVRTASLTGPFGSRVAEYGDGVVTGSDRKALVIDPDVLRSVLAGIWAQPAERVAGKSGRDALLTWNSPYRVEAVFDLGERRLRSLSVSGGGGGSLAVVYSGRFAPWPERVAVKETGSGRSLSLALIAAEPLNEKPAASSP